MVQKMNLTPANLNALVSVNNVQVGVLFNTTFGGEPDWQTQMITFDGAILNSAGSNTILILPVPAPAGGRDDFNIREVVCHFHQLI
jgi:hypothetical protein